MTYVSITISLLILNTSFGKMFPRGYTFPYFPTNTTTIPQKANFIYNVEKKKNMMHAS